MPNKIKGLLAHTVKQTVLCFLVYWGVVKWFKTLGSDPSIRRFESSLPSQWNRPGAVSGMLFFYNSYHAKLGA